MSSDDVKKATESVNNLSVSDSAHTAPSAADADAEKKAITEAAHNLAAAKNNLTPEQILALTQQLQAAGKPTPSENEWKFWNTQPVPKINETVTECGPIETKTLADVMKEPYPLPASFEWDSIDMTDDKQVDEVYKLLNENYVEDDDNMFRFDYSRDFLKWALLSPGFRREWHCGVRTISTKKLVAFITATPQKMHVPGGDVMMVEINFLCVHKKLRAKRLAPVLIKEITRRVNLQNIWQAVYTAGAVLPKAVSSCRYYHRSLNPKKLIEIGFTRLRRNMTMASTIKLYKLPNQPQTKGFRPMQKEDVPQVHTLLLNYFQKHVPLYPLFDQEEIAHWLLPREGVVQSFVVANGNHITDFTSFYSLPSTVIGNEKYNRLNAAYSFYNVIQNPSPSSSSSSSNSALPSYKQAVTANAANANYVDRWQNIMTDTLISANNLKFDVFNALDVMENDLFLTKLKFGPGDGLLQYYLYNWRCPSIDHGDVGLVLL